MSKILKFSLVVQVLVAGAIAAAMIFYMATEPAPLNSGRCYEDMPCWNCDTMGNLVCGPRN